MRLQRSFFARPALTVARELLGKTLVKIEPDGTRLSGTISETEAYIGELDLACHAKAGKTKRTQGLYGTPGLTYVYFTYGMHWMLNFVSDRSDFPAGVLLRAMQPIDGLDCMRARRKRPDRELTNGPAKLAQALAISQAWYGYDSCQPKATLYVEDAPVISWAQFTTQPRVGIPNVPEPWRSFPWNYQLQR